MFRALMHVPATNKKGPHRSASPCCPKSRIFLAGERDDATVGDALALIGVPSRQKRGEEFAVAAREEQLAADGLILGNGGAAIAAVARSRGGACCVGVGRERDNARRIVRADSQFPGAGEGTVSMGQTDQSNRENRAENEGVKFGHVNISVNVQCSGE